MKRNVSLSFGFFYALLNCTKSWLLNWGLNETFLVPLPLLKDKPTAEWDSLNTWISVGIYTICEFVWSDCKPRANRLVSLGLTGVLAQGWDSSEKPSIRLQACSRHSHGSVSLMHVQMHTTHQPQLGLRSESDAVTLICKPGDIPSKIMVINLPVFIRNEMEI